jgi:hypothetical protein
MKKLMLLLVSFLLLSASDCQKNEQPGTRYVFDKTYVSNQETQSIRDVYKRLRDLEVDSFPMSQWITGKYNTDNGFITQKILVLINDSVRYDFIYNTFTSPDSTFYQFKIRKKAFTMK